MRKDFSMEKFLGKLKTDKLITALGMPLEYMPGLPVIRSLNGAVCITIPFFMRRIAKKTVEDGTKFDVVETYPIRYSVTYALRAINLPDPVSGKESSVLAGNGDFLAKTITEGRPVAFEDLSCRPDYTMPGRDGSGRIPVNSDLPVGVFTAGKTEYSEKLKEVYKLYDEAINTRLYEGRIEGTVENRLINKLGELLEYEPALKPFYALLDSELYGRRLSGTEA